MYMGESDCIRKVVCCCVGYTAHAAYRNVLPVGLGALKIRMAVWKNVATVQNKIIFYCFKTLHSRFFMANPRILFFEDFALLECYAA
jgi:hypothetical protein